jgi:hypothetical protein
MKTRERTFTLLEGRQVSVALQDGTRNDDSSLVSGGRRRARTLWLFANGEDVFVPIDYVVDVWEPETAA